MRKLSLLTLFLLIAAPCAFGHANPYFSISHVRKGKDLHFPILNLRRNVKTETKINRLMQLSELRSLVDEQRRNVFDQAVIDDGSIYGGKIALSFQIYSNNSRLLSLSFDSSSCGATCNWWVNYYNFNSQNGDLISLSDLFSADGYKRFSEMVLQKRSNVFRAEVLRKVSPEEREAFSGVLSLFEIDDLREFSIGNGSITVDGYNLLHKSLRFNDVNMKVRFSLGEFRNLLNDYGRIVFGLRAGSMKAYRSTQLPQLFSGNINGASPFVAVISESRDGQIEGIYAYLRYRKGIYLTGQLFDGNVTMTEHVLVRTTKNLRTNSNHRFIDGGSISGTFDGNRLKGMWADKNNTRSHSIVAVRD